MSTVLALAPLTALLAIWVVYPLVMALLGSRRARRPSAIASPAPTVSVIVATREAESAIRERVRNVFQTGYDLSRLKVIVAVDRNGPPLRDLGGEGYGPVVRVVGGDEPGGKAAALNAAVRESRADVLVFADTHQRFDADTIPRLVAALADPAVGAVSGCLELASRTATVAERYWLYERWLRDSEARVHSTVGVTGAVYAMRRSLWEPLPGGLILDDVFIPMRLALAGHRIGFEPEARAFETRPARAASEYRRKVRTLTGVLQLCRWLPGVLSPARNPVWAQFLFHKLLRFATPVLLLLPAIGALGWAIRFASTHTPTLAIALVASLPLLLLARPRLRDALREIALMQAAIVAATVNGLRGRWDVW